MKDQMGGAPIFVKIDDYKEVLDVMEMIKDKIKEIRATLGAINTLRSQEEAEIAGWNKTIDDIEGKIDDIGKSMFEPEQESVR